jgi:hypothetical protein
VEVGPLLPLFSCFKFLYSCHIFGLFFKIQLWFISFILPMELTYFMVLGMGWFSNFIHLSEHCMGKKFLFGPHTMLINMGV